MKKPIINIDEIELKPRDKAFLPSGKAAQKYEARIGNVFGLIGAQKLGYNLTAVPAGKRAFPAHHHRVNEEMFFILEGTGEVRIGEHIYPVRAGDIIACPPGSKETAHQLINTGTGELKYLALSTKLTPEIVEYPDSKKFGILAEFPNADGENPRRFVFVGRENLRVDYWEGE